MGILLFNNTGQRNLLNLIQENKQILQQLQSIKEKHYLWIPLQIMQLYTILYKQPNNQKDQSKLINITKVPLIMTINKLWMEILVIDARVHQLPAELLSIQQLLLLKW